MKVKEEAMTPFKKASQPPFKKAAMTPLSDFAEATGLLRVLEKKLLNGPAMERILDAPSPVETLSLLSQNSAYDFSGLSRPEDYEEILQSALRELYNLLYKISPVPEVVDIPAAKYDYHNIKTALKSHYLGSSADSLFVSVTRISPQTIWNASSSGQSNELPEHLARAIILGKEAYDDGKDPQAIDIALDRAMFEHMRALAKYLDNEHINKYLGHLIDFHNLKTLLRVRNMRKGLRFLNNALMEGGSMELSLFIENYDKSVDNIAKFFYYKYFGDIMKRAVEDYEKSGNFSGLEKLTDNFIMEHVKQSKYIAFGPEPLFSYILAKENEIRQVRIILTCKINGIPGDTLRERLRDNYA